MREIWQGKTKLLSSPLSSSQEDLDSDPRAGVLSTLIHPKPHPLYIAVCDPVGVAPPRPMTRPKDRSGR